MPLRYVPSINRAGRRFAAYMERQCDRLGVTPAEGHLLGYLYENGPCPIGQLQDVMGQKPSTLTGVVDRLVQRRLLVRKPNSYDRRSVLVALTGEGRAAAERVQQALRRLEEDIEAHLEPGHVSAFQAVIGAISTVTEENGRTRILR